MKLKGLSIFLTVLVTATPALARNGNVLIQGARVFDGTRMLGVRDVLVRDGRIAAVARRLKAPAGIETVEAKGRVLIPGLIDGHVHVFPGAQADALRFGVTTVFDMYSIADRPTIDRWRMQRASVGKVAEADTYTAGIGATPPGGHPMELFKDMPAGMAMPPTLAAGGRCRRLHEGQGCGRIRLHQGAAGRRHPAGTRSQPTCVHAAAFRGGSDRCQGDRQTSGGAHPAACGRKDCGRQRR